MPDLRQGSSLEISIERDNSGRTKTRNFTWLTIRKISPQYLSPASPLSSEGSIEYGHKSKKNGSSETIIKYLEDTIHIVVILQLMMSGHSHSDIMQQLNLRTGTYYRYLAEAGYCEDRQQLFKKKYNRKDESDKLAMEMVGLRDRLTEGYRRAVAIATSKDSTLCVKRSRLKKRQYSLLLEDCR